ncbi:MAG: Na+/H+ antiporter subunit E [Spirochaetota bacterium]
MACSKRFPRSPPSEGSVIRLQRVKSHILAIIVLVVVWCIWNESFEPVIVAAGVLFAATALIITNTLLLRGVYEQRYRLRFVSAVRYVLVTIVEVFKSGVSAIVLTLQGRIDPCVIEITTDGSYPLRAILIANAITLTPGTVTIDYSEGNLKVIWIHCATNDPEIAGEMIKGSFERALGSPRASVADVTAPGSATHERQHTPPHERQPIEEEKI